LLAEEGRGKRRVAHEGTQKRKKRAAAMGDFEQSTTAYIPKRGGGGNRRDPSRALNKKNGRMMKEKKKKRGTRESKQVGMYRKVRGKDIAANFTEGTREGGQKKSIIKGGKKSAVRCGHDYGKKTFENGINSDFRGKKEDHTVRTGSQPVLLYG